MERLGQKWKQLQAELGRSADACRDKYRELAASLPHARGLVPLPPTAMQVMIHCDTVGGGYVIDVGVTLGSK